MSTPNPGDLGKVFKSAYVRRLIYSVYIVGIVILGGFQVAFAASATGAQPEWLTIALAVAAYLGVPIGGLAAANTQVTGLYKPEEE